MADSASSSNSNSHGRRVLLTGASGFVGQYVLRALVDGGYAPVCLVRSAEKFERTAREADAQAVTVVEGDLMNAASLRRAAEQSELAIHLVGIIREHKTQTFSRVHYQGSRMVVDACQEAGVKRYVHMSALGARSDAVSKYHQTKYQAEQLVRNSNLNWTILQPSLIHGPESEFLGMMKSILTHPVIPFVPYIGDGTARLQPVDVRDVADCFVEALNAEQTFRKTYPLGGPRTYSWKELYNLLQRHIPGARQWKPSVGQPVLLAKVMASTVMKVPVPESLEQFKFNMDQVLMTQEDNICDIAPTERDFQITFRDFETELTQYADRIE